MAIIKRAVTLRETPHGWLWMQYARYFATAAAAKRAVDKDSKALCRRDSAVISLITWEPTTVVGSMAVKAIAGGER